MKELSLEKQIYLCKYAEIDRLGISYKRVKQILDKLKSEGLYEKYKNMPEEEYERIIQEENKKNKEALEILNKMKKKYKIALFMVIRNSIVMPKGIELQKSSKEISQMSYETLCEVLTMIDFKTAEKMYEEGKMPKIDKLREQEEQLEQERMNYLEADDNKGAKRVEKKLWRIRELIEVENENGYIEMKRKLKIYREYIHITGLEKPFKDFYEKEMKKLEE